MKIALAHFRVGETDGVSLEMEKWKLILERMGHEVVFLAGSEGAASARVIEELHYRHPKNLRIVENAYERLQDYPDEAALEQDVREMAERLENGLLKLIERERIDLIIPNNIWSLGWSLPAGIAFARAAQKTNIRFLCHHHDFYWERERYSRPTCRFVEECLERYFPPDRKNVEHVVINRIAKSELQKRKGIEASVVPNVFDFASPTWSEDEYNRDFREAIGVKPDDVIVLQATRIAERKAIELGIEVVAQMQSASNRAVWEANGLYNGKAFTESSRIVYVLAGMPEASATYIEQLKKKAAALGVDMRWIHDRIDHSRKVKDGKKVYSLWDAYVHADLITYPSLLEGWGNQLLEGVFAKKPLVIYEYPVYLTDIRDKGFSFISLGAHHTVDDEGLAVVPRETVREAGKKAVELLADPVTYRNITEHNFDIAKKFYSYEALQRYLVTLPIFS